MRVGFCGLGKLGLPVAYTFASKGHEVHGYDINSKVKEYIETGEYPEQEEGLKELMDNYIVNFHDDLIGMVENSDMIFVPIQTPHEPLYEGSTPLPDTRVDFDYEWLIDGIKDLANVCYRLQKQTDIVIISTVLPGTINRLIKPLLNEYTTLIYEPMFIAMGTVVNDVLNPEFVLVGVDGDHTTDNPSVQRMWEFYGTIHDKQLFVTDIVTAEAIKVSYNTFITTKTVLGNLWGEIAHKTGANVDDIFQAWSLSTDRLISNKYLRSGVGDGGGCHPRDNIALSWLARKLNLSYDYFESLMLAREMHMQWIGSLAEEESSKTGLPVRILGEAFKPGTRIKTGSPSCLLSELCDFPIVPEEVMPKSPAVYVVGVQHKYYQNYKFPNGSVVIDPFGYIPDTAAMRVIRIGRK